MLLDRLLVELSNHGAVAVVIDMAVDYSRDSRGIHIEITKDFTMACGIDPGVVDWARVAAGLFIDLLENLDFLVEALKLIINGHDGWKDSDSARLVGLADIVVVFLAAKFFELTWHDIASLLSVFARVLLSESLDSQFFFIRLILLWEHFQ